jgi:glycosyltransferase involved in cell wall biosynthesis
MPDNQNQQVSDALLVSLVIPCFNEERFIRQCLESVLAWDSTGCELEILVIDGGSADRTRQIVREIQEQDTRIRLLHNPKRIKPVALNIGIRAARGDWIIRLDAHAEYPIEYLKQCLNTARRTGADNIGGIVITQLRDNTVQAQLVQALTTHRFGVGSEGFRVDAPEGQVDTVPYGCYRREVFEKIGYFDEHLIHSQDFEFNQRLLRAGGTIWLNPAIRVLYYNQATLGHFFRKVIGRDGPWGPYMWYVAPYSLRLRHAIPMAFVLALIIGMIAAACVLTWGWILLVTLLAPYSFLAIVSGIQQAMRFRKWWMLFLLPCLFFAYHIAYGLGELWGFLLLTIGKAPIQRARNSSSHHGPFL